MDFFYILVAIIVPIVLITWFVYKKLMSRFFQRSITVNDIEKRQDMAQVSQRPSLANRFLWSIVLTVFSRVVSFVYILFSTRNTEMVSWEGFAYELMALIVAILTFIISFIALSTVVDRRQFTLTVVFIALLVIFYPLLFDFANVF